MKGPFCIKWFEVLSCIILYCFSHSQVEVFSRMTLVNLWVPKSMQDQAFKHWVFLGSYQSFPHGNPVLWRISSWNLPINLQKVESAISLLFEAGEGANEEMLKPNCGYLGPLALGNQNPVLHNQWFLSQLLNIHRFEGIQKKENFLATLPTTRNLALLDESYTQCC